MYLGNTAMYSIMQSTTIPTANFAFYESYLWVAEK